MNFPSHAPRPSIHPALEQPIPLDETDFLDDNGEDFFERETKPFDCAALAVCAA